MNDAKYYREKYTNNVFYCKQLGTIIRIQTGKYACIEIVNDTFLNSKPFEEVTEKHYKTFLRTAFEQLTEAHEAINEIEEKGAFAGTPPSLRSTMELQPYCNEFCNKLIEETEKIEKALEWQRKLAEICIDLFQQRRNIFTVLDDFYTNFDNLDDDCDKKEIETVVRILINRIKQNKKIANENEKQDLVSETLGDLPF
ncbi:hypothetical protein V9L05_08770 [Bernardetia sp. Wsw4-3y2]|uniref:hypothetical protein n=1 Tax=Bernardetia sp. Wsw4-3y2 TaxID=3127471 RepID=UPI0030CD509E